MSDDSLRAEIRRYRLTPGDLMGVSDLTEKEVRDFLDGNHVGGKVTAKIIEAEEKFWEGVRIIHRSKLPRNLGGTRPLR